jgi:predicted transcriptional regulator
MFHYAMLDPLLDEIIEDILHNQTVKEQPIASHFGVSSSAVHFVISHALD